MSDSKTPAEIGTDELIDLICNELLDYRYVHEDTAHKATKRLVQLEAEKKTLKQQGDDDRHLWSMDNLKQQGQIDCLEVENKHLKEARDHADDEVGSKNAEIEALKQKIEKAISHLEKHVCSIVLNGIGHCDICDLIEELEKTNE